MTKWSELRLIITSGLWLCMLPILLRRHALPELLRRTTERNYGRRPTTINLDASMGALIRLCQCPFFRLPLFPKHCMRQSLVLYRAMIRMGYPVAIHFGVHKNETSFRGHSWITVNGRLLGEPGPVSHFTTVYSYPPSMVDKFTTSA
jgi:hypothetical protein